jgi:hypothetical protein
MPKEPTTENLKEYFRKETTLCHEIENQTRENLKTIYDYPVYFERTPGSITSKLMAFPKHVTRQMISKLLARYELFKKILHVHGSIVEIGVCAGNGTFSFAHFSSILEPYNYSRKIIGFDTFEGYSEPTRADKIGKPIEHMKKGAYFSGGYYENILEGAKLFDANRPLGHMPKIEIVKGPVKKTISKYVQDYPDLVVAMLCLDVGLEEATTPVLNAIYDRIPKGGIVTFDTIGISGFPGQNKALHEFLKGYSNVRIERFEFEPARTYFIKE